MKNRFKYLMSAALYATIVILVANVFSSIAAVDIVANRAIDSFESLGRELELHEESRQHYDLRSPDGTEVFTFGQSIMLTFDLAPFTVAGFVPQEYGNALVMGETTFSILADHAGVTPQDGDGGYDVFEAVLRSNRHALEYHMDHDLFELHLGHGNAFRWARDLQTNTRGMTFVLNPEPFIEAGLNPELLKGWALVDITVMHGADRGQRVPRLIKNFSLSAE